MRGNDPTATTTLATTSPGSAAGALALIVVVEGERLEFPLPARGDVTLGRAEDCTVSIANKTLSRHHVQLAIGETLTIRDLGSKNGTRLRGQRLDEATPVTIAAGTDLLPGDVFEPGGLVCFVKRLSPTPRRRARPSEIGARDTPRGDRSPILRDPGMHQLYALLERVARGDISVLLLGETGVGKEVAARFVHEKSRRGGGPFVALNCAALSPALLESELFGHERGAFTGAVGAKEGLFESAREGTVFLDEVGELPATVQATLLRVLEERTVTPVGSTRARPIDVRLVAATNRDLAAEVASGRFRRDLFFRLNGVAVEIPPLRERRSEIVPLAEAFLARSTEAGPDTLSGEAKVALEQWDWPGNVREVRNVIERAALLAPGGVVEVEHLGLPTSPVPFTERPSLKASLDAIERERIIDALARAGGNQTRAAASLGMPRRTFILRLETYGVSRPRRK